MSESPAFVQIAEEDDTEDEDEDDAEADAEDVAAAEMTSFLEASHHALDDSMSAFREENSL